MTVKHYVLAALLASAALLVVPIAKAQLSPAKPAPGAVPSPSVTPAPSVQPAAKAAPMSQAALAPVSPEVEGVIRKSIAAWTNDKYKVEDVRRTPLAGMYEVRIGSDLFYVDEKANYIFLEGSMIELKNNRNLTRERLDDLMTINFNDLPVNLAIKQVNGSGKRKIALFEDPNCGYCRKLRADLNKVPDLTVYTFAYPILAADSDLKSKKALCAKDTQKAWNDLMIQGKVPDNPGTCATPIDKFKQIGQKYNITATPTIFLTNGKRIQGYMPPDQFAKVLAMVP